VFATRPCLCPGAWITMTGQGKLKYCPGALLTLAVVPPMARPRQGSCPGKGGDSTGGLQRRLS
jgi:hypothetical protein